MTWNTANGTATVADNDFVGVSPTVVSFANGQTVRTVWVTIRGDTRVEADESFSVKLTAPSGATIADATGLGQIISDDGSALTTNDPSVTEGHTGTVSVTFSIIRAGSTSGPSTVKVSTVDGTATVADDDYCGVPLTSVAFAAGERTKSVAVCVKGDTKVEGNETFSLKLSAPSGATIVDGTGVARIVNDDLPALAINDVSVTEGHSGSVQATFAIGRPAGGPSSCVYWRTGDQSATAADGDYRVVSPTRVCLGNGQTALSVAVEVFGDNRPELTETFLVELSAPSGATIADGTGVGTILNDDPPVLSIVDASVPEGNSNDWVAHPTFRVTRSGDLSYTSTVKWRAAAGSATADDFYVPWPDTLTFNPGETAQNITMRVLGDTTFEADETMSIELLVPTGATIGDGAALGTIVNDDRSELYRLDVNSNTVQRGGTTSGTVHLNGLAPPGGATVALSSDNPAITVPADLFLPEGWLSKPFPIAAAVVSDDTTARVCATYPADVSRCSLVTVQAPRVAALGVDPSHIRLGEVATGTVTLDRAVLGADFTVQLRSGNEAATVPSSVVLSSGQTSASFPVESGGWFEGVRTATITASANGTAASDTVAVRGEPDCGPLAC